MKESNFLEQRNSLLDKKEAFLNGINKEYTKLVNEFINENSPVENFKVYELIKNGKKRRGFKRFVIYKHNLTVYFKTDIFITVGGWWLDNENTPTKWDTMTVMGVSNSAEFVLSENQINKKHPDSK
jgi:hypothetical protein